MLKFKAGSILWLENFQTTLCTIMHASVHVHVHVQKHAQKHLSPQTKHLSVVGYLIGKFLHVK